MNFLFKIQKFMYGRYGRIDNLNKLLLTLYIFMLTANLFMKNHILSIIELVFIFIVIFRFLSKNIYRRSNENTRYLKILKFFSSPFKNIKRNKNDKDHIYKRCHHCHKTLKLPIPYKKGIKHVKCTHCHKRNTFIITKKVKIEIIK